MKDKPVSKEPRRKERELLFYLRHYQELKYRGRYVSELNHQINNLIERLKERFINADTESELEAIDNEITCRERYKCICQWFNRMC